MCFRSILFSILISCLGVACGSEGTDSRLMSNDTVELIEETEQQNEANEADQPIEVEVEVDIDIEEIEDVEADISKFSHIDRRITDFCLFMSDCHSDLSIDICVQEKNVELDSIASKGRSCYVVKDAFMDLMKCESDLSICGLSDSELFTNCERESRTLQGLTQHYNSCL